MISGLQRRAEVGDELISSDLTLVRRIKSGFGPVPYACRPRRRQENVCAVGASEALGVVFCVERQVLRRGVVGRIGHWNTTQTGDTDTLGRFNDTTPAEKVQVGANLLVSLDLGNDAHR